MRLNSGILRDKIRLERPVTVTDSVGGQFDSWLLIADNWSASVLPLTGRGGAETESFSGVASYTVLLRLSSETEGVDETCRLTWRGLVMRIQSAATDRVDGNIRLVCETGAGIVL